MESRKRLQPVFFGASFGVLLLGVLVSGNPAVSLVGKDLLYPIVSSCLLLRCFFFRIAIGRSDFFVFLVFLFVSLIHFLTYGGEVVLAGLGFLLKLGIAFSLVKLVPDFLVAFPRVMVLLSLLSFIFFLPSYLGLDVVSFLAPFRFPLEGSDIVHIGIHNFHLDEERGRNSGMFWEPGAFSGYLVFAILLLIASGNSFNRFFGIVLVAGVLSAQSTTGYIALFFASLAFVSKVKFAKSKGVGVLLASVFFVLVVCAGSVLYGEVPFLKEKIDQQLEMTESKTGNYEINRIGNFLYDLDLIVERPFFGWTPRQALRGGGMDLVSAQGNGLTGFAVNFGLVGFLTFLCTAFFGFVRLFKSFISAFFATISILVLLVGEQFLSYPLFLVLFFLPGYKRTTERREADVSMGGVQGAR